MDTKIADQPIQAERHPSATPRDLVALLKQAFFPRQRLQNKEFRPEASLKDIQEQLQNPWIAQYIHAHMNGTPWDAVTSQSRKGLNFLQMMEAKCFLHDIGITDPNRTASKFKQISS